VPRASLSVCGNIRVEVPEGIRGKLWDIVVCLVLKIAILIDTYELLSAECVTRYVSRCDCQERLGEVNDTSVRKVLRQMFEAGIS